MSVASLARMAAVAVAAVVLLAAPVPAGAARVKYTVTATFEGSQTYTSSSVDPVYGPAYSWRLRRTNWVARSVRPFVLYRWKMDRPLYQLNTDVKGTISHTGQAFWSGHPERKPPQDPPHYPAQPPIFVWQDRLDPLVEGKVFMSSTSPAVIHWDIGPEFSFDAVAEHFIKGDVETVNHTTGYWFSGPKGKSKRFDIARHFGKPFSVTVSRPGSLVDDTSVETSTQTWTLRFTPTERYEPDRERWQIDVSGMGRGLWGERTGVRAGVDVDWTVRTILDLEDDEVTGKTSRVIVTAVRPFSEPPGAFTVTSKVSARPSYVPRVSKSGDSVRLNLWKPTGGLSEYRVSYTVTPAGQQFADILRRYGIVGAETLYQNLLARGPVSALAFDLVPSGPVVARLQDYTFDQKPAAFDPNAPCTTSGVAVPDCFLARNGERVTVTRLK